MKFKDVRTIESLLKEYGMSSGPSTSVGNQKSGSIVNKPSSSSLKKISPSIVRKPSSNKTTNPKELSMTTSKAGDLEKDFIFPDEKGNEYIDAISSWYTCMFGHCNDFIINKVKAQMDNLDQVMFSDFTHEPAVRLSEELIKILPENQNRIFFNDNGSTAVEAAIKMALQYYFNLDKNLLCFLI